MRRTFALLTLLVTLPAAAMAAPAKPVTPPHTPETAAVNAPVDYSKPGPEHARLATLAGHWTSVYHVAHAPGAKPVDIPGTAEFRAILNGMWISGETELVMGETRIKGLAIYGFDRVKAKYTMLFVQEADSQPLFGYGVPDSSGRVITFDVPMDIPMAGLSAVPMRVVLELPAGDTCGFEMNTKAPDGSNYRPLRIDYTRAK